MYDLTAKACKHLMDYLFTHPKDIIHFHTSDMILSLVHDATYLVLPDSRSLCATLYTLSNAPTFRLPTTSWSRPFAVSQLQLQKHKLVVSSLVSKRLSLSSTFWLNQYILTCKGVLVCL